MPHARRSLRIIGKMCAIVVFYFELVLSLSLPDPLFLICVNIVILETRLSPAHRCERAFFKKDPPSKIANGCLYRFSKNMSVGILGHEVLEINMPWAEWTTSRRSDGAYAPLSPAPLDASAQARSRGERGG